MLQFVLSILCNPSYMSVELLGTILVDFTCINLFICLLQLFYLTLGSFFTCKHLGRASIKPHVQTKYWDIVETRIKIALEQKPPNIVILPWHVLSLPICNPQESRFKYVFLACSQVGKLPLRNRTRTLNNRRRYKTTEKSFAE